jgi:hypothetical protein
MQRAAYRALHFHFWREIVLVTTCLCADRYIHESGVWKMQRAPLRLQSAARSELDGNCCQVSGDGDLKDSVAGVCDWHDEFCVTFGQCGALHSTLARSER